MIARKAADFIARFAEQFPAILIVGPRQCGKTTLARHFLSGEYFDLEKPSDRQLLAGDAELALRRFPGPCIFDEAQVLPELFPVLRSLIDEQRDRAGRFYLLGSVNPALVRAISESLAGRVGVAELTPFLFPEVAAGADIVRLWLRGGYPDAFQATDGMAWQLWQESYLRTVVERDLARQGVSLSPVELRRLLGMLAHHHGGLLNASELGRAMGVSYHAVQRCLDVLEGHFLVRRLPPYHANLGKRLIKSPKVYVRDSGLLHHLLGISAERGLLESPQRGNSWEGFLIEQIAALERLLRPGSQFYFYGTHAGAEVDLVIDRGQERIGYEFKCAASVGTRDWANLRRAREEGVIHHGNVVYLGEREFPVADGVSVRSAAELLLHYDGEARDG
ncbi:MAG: ATP-binding protein [Planctomycetes bacterium]|nr:ATP-binding protein [Planctomycetota bacterium]